jgi:hypothetical protein
MSFLGSRVQLTAVSYPSSSASRCREDDGGFFRCLGDFGAMDAVITMQPSDKAFFMLA